MVLLPSLIHPERNDKKFWFKILLLSSFFPVLFANLDMLRGGTTFSDAGNRILGLLPSQYFGFLLGLGDDIGVVYFKIFLFSPDLVPPIFSWHVSTRSFSAFGGDKDPECLDWSLGHVFFIWGFKGKKICFSFLSALLVALCLRMSPQDHRSFSNSSHQLNSFSWRVEVWKGSLAWIGERWAFGYGLGSFHDLSEFSCHREKGVEAHNAYLQLWFETGVVGVLAYLSIYWNLFVRFIIVIKNQHLLFPKNMRLFWLI